MKKKIIFSFTLLTLMLSLAPPAGAQTQNDMITTLRTAMERTDQIIDRAREMVRASSSPIAALALEQAIALQRQAWDNFRKGNVEGYTIAAKLTQKAREQAKRALASARISEQGEEVVLRKLERTQELLRRAHEAIPRGVDESLRTIFESARRNLQQAWEFYRSGQYRPAVKLANQVENTAKRLLQIANRQHNLRLNFERRSEAVKELLERIREGVSNCQSETAQRLLQQAREAYQEAIELAENGRLEPAVKHLQQARRLATRAADHCGRVDGLRSRMERLATEAERLRDEIRPGDETAANLLEQVFSQLENARGFIERQDREAAAAALKAAQLTLKQLRRYLNSSDF